MKAVKPRSPRSEKALQVFRAEREGSVGSTIWSGDPIYVGGQLLGAARAVTT